MRTSRVARMLLLSSMALCLPPNTVWAVTSGTEGAAFLEIPVGAGPASLGNAYSALATDAYAPVENPAGLRFLGTPQLAAQHLSYLDSINYEFLSYVHPLSHHQGIGVSAQYLNSGSIPGTDINDNPTGNFSSHYGSYNLSYGAALNPRLSLGLTGKWINAQLQDVSGNAFAVDLGSLYKFSNTLTLAGTITDFGSRLNFLQQSNPLPLAFHAGMAYKPSGPWMLTNEVVFPNTGLISWHGGVEWQPAEFISLRTGYRTDTLSNLGPLAGYTAGIGLHVWGQEFSYAWSPYGDLGTTHYFSLLIRFGKPESLVHITHLKQPLVQKGEQTPDDEMQLMLKEDEKETNTAQKVEPLPSNSQ